MGNEKNINKKVYVLICMSALVISIIMVIVLQIQNRKLEKLNNEIQSKYEGINKKVDEFASKNIQLLTQVKQGEDIIKELQIENKLLKENAGETDLDKEQRDAADENSNSNEKEEMINKARKFFADRGIKISSNGYSEMVGTNLYTDINELEGHRVFAFTIENYDIKDNNIWFYYSPETNVGYKYENDTWTKL